MGCLQNLATVLTGIAAFTEAPIVGLAGRSRSLGNLVDDVPEEAALASKSGALVPKGTVPLGK